MTNKNFTPLEVKVKSANSANRIYKEDEFEAFIDLIGESNIGNWSIMAQALKVDRNTVQKWREHPKAKAAIKQSLAKSIEGMETAGRKDWRMYREKAKMLGVEDSQNIDLTSDGKPLEVIFKRK